MTAGAGRPVAGPARRRPARVVVQRGLARLDGQLAGAAEGGRGSGHTARSRSSSSSRSASSTARRVPCARATSPITFGGLARLQHAHGHHRRPHRVDRVHRVPGARARSAQRRHRVPGQVRVGAVPAAAGDGDGELVHPGVHHSRVDRDAAGRDLRLHVHPDHRPDPLLVQQPGGDHVPAPRRGQLLARLQHQPAARRAADRPVPRRGRASATSAARCTSCPQACIASSLARIRRPVCSRSGSASSSARTATAGPRRADPHQPPGAGHRGPARCAPAAVERARPPPAPRSVLLAGHLRPARAARAAAGPRPAARRASSPSASPRRRQGPAGLRRDSPVTDPAGARCALPARQPGDPAASAGGPLAARPPARPARRPARCRNVRAPSRYSSGSPNASEEYSSLPNGASSRASASTAGGPVAPDVAQGQPDVEVHVRVHRGQVAGLPVVRVAVQQHDRHPAAAGAAGRSAASGRCGAAACRGRRSRCAPGSAARARRPPRAACAQQHRVGQPVGPPAGPSAAGRRGGTSAGPAAPGRGPGRAGRPRST